MIDEAPVSRAIQREDSVFQRKYKLGVIISIEGAFGDVATARTANSMEIVAVKKNKKHYPGGVNIERIVSQIRSEFNIVINLRNAHILRYIDLDTPDNATFFLVMEYCPNGTLHSLITKEPMQVGLAARFTAQVAIKVVSLLII